MADVVTQKCNRNSYRITGAVLVKNGANCLAIAIEAIQEGVIVATRRTGLPGASSLKYGDVLGRTQRPVGRGV